jgi:hypothetical protein
MTHIYIVLLCGSAITKLAEKRQNNCGKEKKKMETSCLFEKRENTITEKRKHVERRSYLWKRDKTIAEKRKKCGNVVLICGKGTKQLFPHFTTDCEKIVLLTSEFNCSRHLIGQFLFCRDYFLSNCD